MQKEPRGGTVGILVEVIEPAGIEGASSSDKPVHFITAGK